MALTLLTLLVVAGLGIVAMREPLEGFATGLPVLLGLTAGAHLIAGNSLVNGYGLEVVIWSLLIGLLISNTLGVPGWLRGAVKTEYFIKIGLVLLGAEVLFATVVRVGAYGMVQAIVVILAVFTVCFRIARRLGLDDEFASILGAAVSICGVSAAIAAGGAVKGDPKKVSHTISLVLLCAIPMLILQPIIAKAVGMPALVAGAWIGGTIDTTGAVVAAGEIAGREAMSVAVVTKMAQNVLIGVAAFVLAVWFSLKAGAPGEKPRAAEIWHRFPKFIVGFIAASVVFSFVVPASAGKEITGITAGLRGWWFTLGFLSIGLDTRFRELVALGHGRPAAAFLSAQVFNLVWTLLVAYLLFGGVLFSPPPLG